MKHLLTTTLLLLTVSSTHAQTYTLPDGAPLLLNPALTGMHNGTLRVNTIVRTGRADPNQKWNELWSTTTADYRTKSWGHGRQYAGIGMAYTYWQGGYNTIFDNVARVSAAWHLQGGHKKTYQLSVGLQAGFEKHTEYVVPTIYYNYATGNTRETSVGQLGVGITYSSQLSQTIRYIAGYHLTNSLFISDEPTKPFSLEEFTNSNHSLLFGSEISSNSKLTVRPSFICRFRMANFSAMGGTEIRYQPKKTAYFWGLWCPYTSSMAVSAGVARNHWRIMSCYRLDSYEHKIPTRGTSHELSLQYIFTGTGRPPLPLVRY